MLSVGAALTTTLALSDRKHLIEPTSDLHNLDTPLSKLVSRTATSPSPPPTSVFSCFTSPHPRTTAGMCRHDSFQRSNHLRNFTVVSLLHPRPENHLDLWVFPSSSAGRTTEVTAPSPAVSTAPPPEPETNCIKKEQHPLERRHLIAPTGTSSLCLNHTSS